MPLDFSGIDRISSSTTAPKPTKPATVTTEEGKAEILQALRDGTDIYAVTFAAIDLIAGTDQHFRDQAAELLRTVYGRGMGATHPLQAELAETRDRASRIWQYANTHPDMPAGEAHDLGQAWKALRKREKEISELLGI